MKRLLAFVMTGMSISAAMAANFDGVYSGLNIGWGRPANKVTATGNSNAVKKTFQGNAITVGVQAGYAMTTSQKLYVGGELNFNYDGLNRKKTDWNLANIGWGGSSTSSRKVWHMALAGKGGYNFGPAIAYLGGFMGLASHQFNVTYNGTSGTAARRGVVYGPLLGTEFKVTERLTAGLEGRMDYGSGKKKVIANKTFKVEPRGFDARARVNFAF